MPFYLNSIDPLSNLMASIISIHAFRTVAHSQRPMDIIGIGMIEYWQTGNIFSVMANQDRLVGTNINEANVVNNLNMAFKLYPNYDKWVFNDDALYESDT